MSTTSRPTADLRRFGPFVLLLLAPALLCAQTARLQGRVTDSSGAVVPAAQVTVVNSTSGVKLSTETNQQGEYSVPFLPPGQYDILIEHSGFKSYRRSGVHLEVDQTAGIDLTLDVGAATQTVEVSGESPLLQTQTSSVGQTIDNKTVSTLPLNGRDYTQLVTLAAGATPNPRSRASNGFNLNGSQSFQNTMLLDGVDNNNYLLGADSKNMNALTPPSMPSRSFTSRPPTTAPNTAAPPEASSAFLLSQVRTSSMAMLSSSSATLS